MQTERTINNYFQWFVLLGIILGRYVEVGFVFLLLLICKRKYNCLKVFALGLCLCIHFYIADTITNYPSDKFWQQFLTILILLLGYYQFFHNYVSSISELWRKYMKIALWCCYIGYVQYLIFYVTGNDYIGHIFSQQELVETRVRMTSVFLEPGNFAAFLVPAVSYSFFGYSEDIYRKFEKSAVLLALLLSFTTIGYFMLLVIFIYRYRKTLLKYIWFFIFPLIAFGGFVVNYSITGEKTNFSYLDTMLLKFSNSYQMLGNLSYDLLAQSGDASTFAIFSNLWVADNSPCRLIGTGLGTHEYNYVNLFRDPSNYFYGLNMTDAYSLFTRIFSEFGYVGLVLGLLYLYRYHNLKNPVNVAVLFNFISLLIRGGSYFMYGVIFFLYIYYYTSKGRKLLRNGEEENKKYFSN